jgi:hypothetical protein
MRHFRVHACDHDVFVQRSSVRDDGIQQLRAYALAAGNSANVHCPLNCEAITGPGAEIAEGCESGNLRGVRRHQHRIALRQSAAPPRDSLLHRRRAVVVNRSGGPQYLVVDGGDLLEISLNGVPDHHPKSPATCPVIVPNVVRG